MIIKRLSALLSALIFASLPLFIYDSVPKITVSAAETTLSASQTRALFGDTIHFYYLNTSDQWSSGSFEYLCTGRIGDVVEEGYYDETQTYDPRTHQCVIYYADIAADNFQDTWEEVNVKVRPVIDLSNLNYLRFGIGLSAGLPSDFDPNDVDWYVNNSHFHASQFNYSKTTYIEGVATQTNEYVYYDSILTQQLSSRHCPWFYNVGFLDDQLETFAFAPFSFYGIEDSISVIDGTMRIQFDNYVGGLDQLYYFGKPQYCGKYYRDNGLNQGQWTLCDSSIRRYYYLVIDCPTLSEDYINNNPGSGGGGDNSYPDYSPEFGSIIDKLDRIILDDTLRFAQLERIETKLDSASGKLDGVNSRLDGVNSRLDGNNSRLDGNNSRLDNINSTLNKIDSHLDRLNSDQTIILVPSDSDASRVNLYNSQFDREWSTAMEDHRYVDSVTNGAAEASLPELNNNYSMPDEFQGLWTYTDGEGNRFFNTFLIAMPVLTLTVGLLSYIIFGRAR